MKIYLVKQIYTDGLYDEEYTEGCYSTLEAAEDGIKKYIINLGTTPYAVKFRVSACELDSWWGDTYVKQYTKEDFKKWLEEVNEKT